MKKTAKLAIGIGATLPLAACIGTVAIIATNSNSVSANQEQPPEVVQVSQDNVNKPFQRQEIAYPEQLVECFGYLKDSHNVTAYQSFEGDRHLVIFQGKTGDDYPSFQGITLNDGKCSNLNLGLTQWEGKVPKNVAVEMKKFFWDFLKEYDTAEFTKMITVPSEIATPFFPEDQEAIAALGDEIKVRVFQDEREYFIYSHENDPFILKDHPGYKKKAEEFGIQ